MAKFGHLGRAQAREIAVEDLLLIGKPLDSGGGGRVVFPDVDQKLQSSRGRIVFGVDFSFSCGNFEGFVGGLAASLRRQNDARGDSAMNELMEGLPGDNNLEIGVFAQLFGLLFAPSFAVP